MKKRHEQKLLIIAMLMLMLFNMPLMLLFDNAEPVWGVPVIYIYIFSAWLFSILASAFILKKYYE